MLPTINGKSFLEVTEDDLKDVRVEILTIL